MKKIVSLSLAVSMVLCNMVLQVKVYGEEIQESFGSYSIEEASRMTGFLEEELLTFKEEVGDNFDFDTEVKRLNASLNNVQTRSGNGVGDGGPLPFSVSSYAKAGDIHVTSQDTTPLYAHGHSALAVSNTRNLETLGGSNLSEIRTNSGWNSYGRYTLRRPHSDIISSSDINKMIEYSENNLIGISYSSTSNVYSSKVNCASLVQKAFRYGAGLSSKGGLTGGTSIALPADFCDYKITSEVKSYRSIW